MQRQQRRLQFALGVAITVDQTVALPEFLFAHFALIEGYLHLLQRALNDVLHDWLKDAAQRPDVSAPSLQSLISRAGL